MIRTTSLSTGKLVAFGVAIAVTLLALLPGAWSAAVAQTAGTPTPTATATATETTVAADASATFVADSDKTIFIPAGASSVQMEVTFQPVLDSSTNLTGAAAQAAAAQAFISLNVPPPGEFNSGDAVVVSIFVLEAVDADSNDITFDEPVIMEFELDAATLAAAGGDPNNVVLQFFDEATQEWTAVACTATGTTLSCLLPHFSVWALMVVEEAPAQATPAPADTGDGAFGLEQSGGTNAGLLLLAILGLAGVAGLGARFAARRS